MEESLRQLWVFSIWFAGISTTITLFIFGWLMKIYSRIQIGEEIRNDLARIVLSVDEIKIAMIGTYEKKGLITKHYDLDSRVSKLEEMIMK